MITDAHGTPLAITLTGGNRHDVTQLLPLVDAIPHIRGRIGFDPCPGDPVGVTTLAVRWRQLALVIAEVAVRLDGTDTTQARWKGKAAEAFRDRLNAQRTMIGKFRESCEKNADVLEQWAGRLRELQSEARALETRASAASALGRPANTGGGSSRGSTGASSVTPAPSGTGAGSSGFPSQADRLHQRYLDEARTLARGASALVDLPPGTRGWYGLSGDLRKERLLLQETQRAGGPGAEPGMSGDPLMAQMMLPPSDGGLPYELTGDPPPPTDHSSDGAFQKNEADDYDKASLLQWLLEQQDMNEATVALGGMNLLGLPHAAQFFQHYLNGSGSDLDFDAAQPYHDDPTFRSLVDGTARTEIQEANTEGKTSFDSGYLYHSAPFSTRDWHNAIGGSYYQTTGHQNPDGTWTVNLRITSYYQFRDGQNFYGVSGSNMRDLERDGVAKNFREIGLPPSSTTGTGTSNACNTTDGKIPLVSRAKQSSYIYLGLDQVLVDVCSVHPAAMGVPPP